MSTKWRWILWLSLLALTVVAAIYPTEPAAIATKRKTRTTAVVPTASAPISDPQTKSPNHLPDLNHDPFDPVAWNTPPPPPPPPPVVAQLAPEPAAPVEPPLPYQYQGRMKDEDGSTVIFLSRGQEAISAHVGDTLDTNYKLVSMDDNKLTIAYLPMNHLHDIALEAH